MVGEGPIKIVAANQMVAQVVVKLANPLGLVGHGISYN